VATLSWKPHEFSTRSSFPAHLDNEGQYLASPSLVKLPGGRLLAAAERTGRPTEETQMKLIYASDNSGAMWQQIATVGPMNWPQVTVFACSPCDAAALGTPHFWLPPPPSPPNTHTRTPVFNHITPSSYLLYMRCLCSWSAAPAVST
jgi:hypothetical protein